MIKKRFARLLRTDPLGIRKAVKQVVSVAKHVTISAKAAALLANHLISRLGSPAELSSTLNEWEPSIHYFDGGEKTLHWLLALDAVNFSFWPAPGEEAWQVAYRGKWINGYAAMAYAFKRGVEEGFALWNPNFLSSLPAQRLRYILRGKGEVPMFQERLAHLHEVGEVLQEKFEGTFSTVISRVNHSAIELVSLIVTHFASFRDVSSYGGLTVPFYKRAQLLVSDIYKAFNGKDYGFFRDINHLTAFADYKIPQVLQKFGVLVYSQSLTNKIQSKELIEPGDDMEIEIRAATVESVELICNLMEKKGCPAAPFQLDGLLWNLGQTFTSYELPYHLTRTPFY